MTGDHLASGLGSGLDSGFGAARFGVFHAELLALCFLIAAADGFDTQCISFVAPTLLREWNVPRAEFGPLFSAGLFGAMLGAAVLGSMADRLGRKPTVLGCVLLFAVMSLLSTTVTSVGMLGIYRFLGGVGLGGAIPNIIALVSEYSPTRHRAMMMVTMFCGFPLGAMAGGALSHDLISNHGWQAVFMLGGITPLVLVGAAWWRLPESARYLAERGQDAALQKILARIGHGVRYVSPAVAPTVGASARSVLPASVLFEHGRAPWTLLLWTLCFLGMFLTYFLINWTPLLLVSVGIPQEKAILAVVLLNGGGVAGGLILGRLMDRFSVFGMLTGTFILGAACLYALGIGIEASLTTTLLMTCATGMTLFGGQLNFPGLTANYYPVQMRSTGAGWAMAAGRLGSVAGPLVGGVLVAADFGTRDLLCLAAFPAALVAVVVAVMAKTSRGLDTQKAQPSIATESR